MYVYRPFFPLFSLSNGCLQAQVQPPRLLALALPHLPPPLRSSITNGLQYMQLGGVFLDDIAAIVFGIGVIVLVSTWLAPRV